jgi:uncharacterized membrane protein YkvI
MIKGLIASIICLFLIMVLIVCIFVGGGVILSQLFAISGWAASVIFGLGFFLLAMVAAWLFKWECDGYEK